MGFQRIVRTSGGTYPVIVGRGLLRRELPKILRALGPRRVVVISHPNILDLHGPRLREALDACGDPDLQRVDFLFPEGEENKNLHTVERGYLHLMQAGVSRDDVVLAFGGGVVGDLAGFLAATFMRGMAYVQVPTTLMSMVDSSVGGKTGVDLPGGKNAVGCFHQPAAVLSDVEFLTTIPERELLSGLAEVAKYGFLYDPEILREMGGWPEGRPPEGYDLAGLVARCVEHKAAAVEADERDQKGVRAFLNYGHTFGHALEAATGYRLLRHGEAVALGMIMASRLSFWSGVSAENLEEGHLRLLLPLLRCIRRPVAVSPQAVMERMEADKKRAKGLRFVLLEGWQKPVLLESPSEALVRRAVEETMADLSRWSE